MQKRLHPDLRGNTTPSIYSVTFLATLTRIGEQFNQSSAVTLQSTDYLMSFIVKFIL